MIRLHHAWESRSTRTLALLYEMELPFELTVHSFRTRLYNDEFRKLSPAGRVPALQDGDRVLFETGAITEYLVETYPDAGVGRLSGDPERYEYLQFLHFAETIAQHIASLTQQHVVLREDWMKSPSVMKYEKIRLDRCLGVINAQLAGREYLLASGFSAIDTNVGYGLYAAKYFTTFDDKPDLAAYVDRLFLRPAFRKSLPPKNAERLYMQPFYPLPDV